jgi:hypothetical protein
MAAYRVCIRLEPKYAIAHLNLSEIRLGQKPEARKYYDRAVMWMAKNRPKHHELRRFRAEAEQLLGLKKTPR